MISNRNPTYRFFVIKGHGASVVITHNDGHEETWVGFATKDEAEAWVAKQKSEETPERCQEDPGTRRLLH